MRSVSLRAEVGIPSLCLKPKKLVQLSSNAKIAIPLRRRLPLLRLEIGHSRSVIMGALCVGVGILAVVLSEDKAWALGPQGPLVEEFWDNVRRYGLYALTVSTDRMASMSNRELAKLWKQQQASQVARVGESATEKVVETEKPVTAARGVGESSHKRRREGEKSVSVVNLETVVATEIDKGDTEVQSVERTISACLGENWDPVDHGHERSGVASFWDEKFNHSAHIRGTDLLEGDRGDLEKMSAFSIAKGIESLTNRLSVLSLVNEDKIRGLVRDSKVQGKKLSSLEDSLSKSRADLKWISNERDKLLEGRRAFEEEKKAWAAEKVVLEKELDEARLSRDKSTDAASVFESDLSMMKVEVEKLQNDLQAAKMDSLKKFVEGFDAATSQVKFLHADIDLSGLGYFKEIVDGELMDPPEDD